MTVWIIHHYALAPDAAGGTRHFAAARRLVQAGHRVVIVAASFHYQAHRETRDYGRSWWQREQRDGVEFLWIRTIPYRGNSVGRILNLLSFGWRALRLPLGTLAPRPAAVVGSSPQPFAALAARILARRHRARFVYEVRDLWPRTLVEFGRTSRWNPLVLVFGWIERHCLRRADQVITLLPGSAGYLVAHGADPDRIALVPNGVDLEQAGPVRPIPDQAEFTFLYAGAMGVANGLGALLDAAALLARDAPAVRLVLVGDGPERPRLEARAQALGLGNVAFHPPVPKAAVHELLAGADGFVMILADSPVFGHGISPNKLFDYLAAGRPVVFAVNTPVDPVTEAGAGLRADPRDPASLADAMRRLAALPRERRVAMGANGRAWVERHHDASALARRFGEAVLGPAA